MKFLKLFLNRPDISKRKLLFHLALAGIGSVLILSILNSGAELAEKKTSEIIYVISFGIVIVIYFFAQIYVWRTTSKATESLVHDIRVRLFHKIADLDLENLEKTGKAPIYAAINQHAQTISVSALPVIISLQSSILLVCTLLYIATISIKAFVLLVIAVVTGLWLSIQRGKNTNKYLDTAIESENEVYYSLSDLLEGFKEIKLNKTREEDVLDVAENLTEIARDNRTTANIAMAMTFIGTQSAFYIMLAVLVFLIPLLGGEAYPDKISKITLAGLFMIGPITSVISIMPTVQNVDFAVSLIEKTEDLLDAHRDATNGEVRPPSEFISLSTESVEYSYSDRDGNQTFSIGPISLEVRANDILFITGGNGSGKSTLIKILLGLYKPQKGFINVNGKKVIRKDMLSYRNIFATVLSDFRLFSRAYGLRDIDYEKVDALLEKMGLYGKTYLENGKFNTLDLSTGQKKRLALIISILEERPVMVFDEWAADQDPEFRKVFYHEILPELKNQGKTVIAVTHDEKYFDCAERHLHMVDGRVEELEVNKHG